MLSDCVDCGRKRKRAEGDVLKEMCLMLMVTWSHVSDAHGHMGP